MTFMQTIEADLQAAWGSLDSWANDELVRAWDAVKPVMAGILPAQWTIVQDLITTGIENVQSLSIEQIETAMLNKAIIDELAFITTIKSQALQAIIALFKPQA